MCDIEQGKVFRAIVGPAPGAPMGSCEAAQLSAARGRWAIPEDSYKFPRDFSQGDQAFRGCPLSLQGAVQHLLH